MKLFGMKMNVKNVVLLVLVVLGALSLLKMLGFRTPRVEFMSGGGGDHSENGHDFSSPTIAQLE
jgi:hypothetical protein|tara:strand:- start:37 stop:228 length:192 start_codon:yes stop_codon:yes gene_type:complete